MDKVEENLFDCSRETKANLAFLFESLKEAGVQYKYAGSMLELPEHPIDENIFLPILDVEGRGVTESVGRYEDKEKLVLQELDTYISGIVRQLERLGYPTVYSCDGHDRQPPKISITKDGNAAQLAELLKVLGTDCRVNDQRKPHDTIYLRTNRASLLELAESLSLVNPDWLNGGQDFIKEQLFYAML